MRANLSGAPMRWRWAAGGGTKPVVQALMALLVLFGANLAHGQAIAYRGAGTTAVAGSGNVTPGLPAGWQANDLHLLIVEQKDSVASTVPAGWTPVTGSPINSGASNRAAIWWRVAVAGDTAPLVTHTAGSVIIARVIGFSGVNTTTPLDVNNSFTSSVCDYTTEAAGITTVTANTMLVFVGLIGTEFTSFGTPSGSSAWTSAFLSSTQTGSEASIGAYYGLRAAAGAQPAVTATGTATQCAISFGAQIALRPANVTSSYNQAAYRLFNNVDSTDVGSALAAQNTAATLGSSFAAFRLRMLLGITNFQLSSGTETFKLQFAPRSGSCDTAFSGETYADVTAATVIAYNNNATPADGAALTNNAGDPTDGANTVQRQTYEELNNFASTQDIATGEDGKWDFSLVDNGAPASTAYCFRAVLSTGLPLHTYAVIPEITTGPRGTVFYFHDAPTPDTGTLPAATTLSATTPNVAAATAGTNRDMDQTFGTVQASSALTTLAQTALQKNWLRRFLSRPLAAQTLPTGIWKIQGGASESSNSSNMLPLGMVLKVWRPSTGATVATLLDSPTLGTVEPGTAETNVSKLTSSISGVAVNAGDILVAELWAQNTQGSATANTNTIFYDGTTESSTSSNAAYLQAPGAIAFAAAAGAVGFKISYSNYGLFCLAQSVTITVVDGSGNPVTGYTGTVNLTTTTARGTWAQTAGNGTLTDSVPDDGAASYVWNGADTSATFALSYQAGGAVVTVNAVDSIAPSIHDDGTQGAITFSPSGFTVTSSPFSNPAGGVPAFASPKTAGTSFSVYLTAYGQLPTDATCGIITSYAGARNLKFWSTYVDPATGTIAPTINGTTIATAEGSASAQSVTFTGGQATVSAIYKDAGSLSLSMKDDTTGNPGLPTGIRGSTGTFVSAPANFVVTNIKRTSDNFANPAASSASGTVFITAGQAFTATITAVESGGATTPNYGRESAPESVGFTPTLVLPASGNTPAVAGTAGTFSNGVATGTAFSWPEVGIVELVPHVADGSYMGTGDVIGSATGNVGRFVPNSFSTSLNTPVFGTACAAGGFSYLGQPFSFTVAPVITVTALAFGGATTQNYTGAFFRLTNASLTGRSYTPTPASPALDVSGLPATTGDPAIVDLGAGQGKLTFSAGSGIDFIRGSAVAPFNANIALSINVVDLDGVAAGNPVTFGSGSGIAFSTSAVQRYGRLALKNRVGSELLDLPMSLTTEYYLSSALGFTTNTDDSCSVAPSLAFSGYQGNLSAGQTCVRDTGNPGVSGIGCAVAAGASQRYRATALAGDFNLNLATPGSGHDGAVTVTATAPAWLQYLWNAASGVNSNPSGMATFGLFPGPASRIYQREVY